MNRRLAERIRRLDGTSGMLGVLVIFCLNLAVLPCAMALGLDDQDCPHRPPADEQSMAGHHQNHAAGHHASPQPELRSGCVTSAASCCDAAMPGVDSRASQLKLTKDDNDQPIAAVVSQVLLSTITHAPAVFADPPDPPGTSVPRHVLFCVYLD
jgi:hypothetical protein